MANSCFSSSRILLDHPVAADFVISEWQKNRRRVHVLYLVYRVLACLFVVGSYIGYIATLPYDQKYFFIYLTHWGEYRPWPLIAF